MNQSSTDLVGALPAEHPLDDLADLALALGGDITSFTGHLLQLVAKADPGNRDRLRLAFPRQVGAWELCQEHGGSGLTAGALQEWLDRDPLVRVLSNSRDELLKLTTLKTAMAGAGLLPQDHCTARDAVLGGSMACGRPRPCPDHDG